MKERYLRFPDQCRPLSAPQPPQLRFAIQAQTLGLRVHIQANGCDWRRKPKTNLESVSFPPRNFKISCFLPPEGHSFIPSFLHSSLNLFIPFFQRPCKRKSVPPHPSEVDMDTGVATSTGVVIDLEIYLEFIKHLHIHRALSLLSICVKGA